VNPNEKNHFIPYIKEIPPFQPKAIPVQDFFQEEN
jgi:hypothetical protein